MKNIFKYLTLTLLVVMLSILASCNLLLDAGSVTDKNKENESGNEGYSTQTTSELVNSLEKTEGIAFYKERTGNEPYESVLEVLENTQVDRASVSIKISVTDSGIISGSGTIVDIDDGIDGNDNVFYVLTCFHVIEICEKNKNTHRICVYVPDKEGNTYADAGYDFDKYAFIGTIGGNVNTAQPVSLVGGDKRADVALLRLNVPNSVKNDIVKAKIMSPEYSAKLADSVFAIGNAKGDHPGWLATGNIADESYVTSFDGIGDLTLIGINVNIFPGNSGGGLFNMYGELIGMTNGGVAYDVGGDTIASGINYAIPHRVTLDKETDYGFINIAEQLLGTYIEAQGTNYGYVSGHHELIGYTITRGTKTDLTEYAYISAVVSGSIAETAGLAVGDIVLSVTINETTTEFTSYDALIEILNGAKVGDKITFKVQRDETTITGYNLWGKPQYSTQTVEKDITYSINQSYFCDTGVYTKIGKN